MVSIFLTGGGALSYEVDGRGFWRPWKVDSSPSAEAGETTGEEHRHSGNTSQRLEVSIFIFITFSAILRIFKNFNYGHFFIIERLVPCMICSSSFGILIFRNFFCHFVEFLFSSLFIVT